MITFPLENLNKGELAVFCGAGISVNSGIPVANEIIRRIVTSINIDDSDIKTILERGLPFELLMQIFSQVPEANELLGIYKIGTPNNNHRLLALMAREGYVKTIVTTNFDRHIEEAFDELGFDYNVHFEENDFSHIDYGSNKTNIIKIHGCVSSDQSVRHTLRAIASESLSNKRLNVIDNLFSSGEHSKVLVMGYSCSDKDLVPQIVNITGNRKEVIYFDHRTVSDAKIISISQWDGSEREKIKNTLANYPGYVVIGDVNKLVDDIWINYGFSKITASTGNPDRYNQPIGACIERWARRLFESNTYVVMQSAIFQAISRFDKVIEYNERFLNYLDRLSKDPFESILRHDFIIAGQALAYRNIGVAWESQIEPEKAIGFYEKALERSRLLNDEQNIRNSLNDIGIALTHLGRFNDAKNRHVSALKISKKRNEPIEESNCYLNLGNAYEGLNKLDRAEKLFLKSLEMKRKFGDIQSIPHIYNGLGNLCIKRGKPRDLEDAERYYRRGFAEALEIRDLALAAMIAINFEKNLGKKMHDSCLPSMPSDH